MIPSKAIFTFAAAAALASTGSAQSTDTVTRILSFDTPVSGLGSSTLSGLFSDFGIGRLGGWWCTADLRDTGPSGGTDGAILGQRPGDASISVLRAPELLSGIGQRTLLHPSMAAGQIAYVDAADRVFQGNQSLWIEDVLMATEGSDVTGLPGFTWAAFQSLQLSTTGELLVAGRIDDPSPGATPRSVVASFPSGEILMSSGDFFPGLLFSIFSIEPELKASPDGQHYSALATESTSLDQLLFLDGLPLRLRSGQLAKVGEALPTMFTAPGQTLVWSSFEAPATVNNRGDYSFSAWASLPGGAQPRRIEVRNGLRVPTTDVSQTLIGMDRDGARLDRRPNALQLLSIENITVIEDDPGVDLDGDGIAEPGYSLRSTAPISIRTGIDNQQVILFATLQDASGSTTPAFFRGPSPRIDVVACEGFNNSTGVAGRMIATGSPSVTDNEVNLHMFNLPNNVSGFVIVSRVFGITTQPGGSSGKLCLSGSIGRMIDQVYFTEARQAEATLDLNSIPQPLGAVTATAGETWYAQSWHRDAGVFSSTSNFTDAIEITFD